MTDIKIYSIIFFCFLISGCAPKQHIYFSDFEMPIMTKITRGSFKIGAGGTWPWAKGPRPIRTVDINYDFFISKEPITRNEWGKCVKMKRCKPLDDLTRNHNAALVSWDEAQTYTKWLSEFSGISIRLPSESEWEFAIKGKSPIPEKWFLSKVNNGIAMTSYGFENDEGVYPRLGVHGEWVQDCWKYYYNDLPLDGAPRLESNCQEKTFRNSTSETRFIAMINGRSRYYRDLRGSNIAFRVVHRPN